jgi:hypothetical protein
VIIDPIIKCVRCRSTTVDGEGYVTQILSSRFLGFAKPSTRLVAGGQHFGEMFYTLRTTQTMRAMRIIVPRMPPIYIRTSVTSSEALFKHARVSLSGRYRTQLYLTKISVSWANGQLPLKMRNCGFARLRFERIS